MSNEGAPMKNEQVLKSFTALSFDGKVVTGTPVLPRGARQRRLTAEAGLPDVSPFDEFREMLHQRYSTPYLLSARHRHWGINE